MKVIDRYRYVGITDENTVCDYCGKSELKKTIVLYVLDADDNDDEIVYFGSTCAAKVLSQSTHGGRKILDQAQAAHSKLAREVESARACVARYADVENDERTLRWRFYENHVNAVWMSTKTPTELLTMVRDLLASKRAIISDAELVGL
jgi:hypothetical protein